MNINIKELRLGNIVEYDGFQYEVQGIGFNKIDIGLEDWVDIDYIFGIPIIEICLSKWGFKNEIIENDNFKFQITFHDCWNISFEEKELFGESKVFIRTFLDLHELQNLYNILTKEELIYET